MTVKLVYDMKSCGRCGGSGTYSYCSMYGSTCFKCRGHKKVLSAAGAKASKAVKGFIEANFSVPVEALVPGDRIKIDGLTRTVDAVTNDGVSGYTGPDGATVHVPYFSIHFTKPIKSAYGPYTSMSYCKGSKVTKAVSGADWDAVVAFASTIKRGVTAVAPATEAA